MSKKFYKTNYIPFWTLDDKLPKDHIEDLVNDWVQISNKIDWEFGKNGLILTGKKIPPPYIKCTDETDNYYFYYVGISTPIASNGDSFYYEHTYKLDVYMTRHWQKLQVVLQSNLNVLFLRKFYNRFLTELNSDGTIKTATIDFYQQINYLKAPQEPCAITRSYLYGSTEQTLYSRQQTTGGAGWAALPATVNFPAWDGTTHNLSITTSTLKAPNPNHRYTYLILKSSALINSTGSSGNVTKTTHSDNDKLIIPIIAGDETRIFNLLFNFDITQTYPCILDVSSDNMVGFYDSEVPPSLLLGYMLNQPTQLPWYKSAFFDTSYTLANGIAFFKVPHNFAFPLRLSTSNDAGLSQKLMFIFRNAMNIWDADTEPLFLSDNYYREIHQIDQTNRLETTMSLVNLTIQGNTYQNINTGINIYSYEFFDSMGTSTYYYVDNNGVSCSNDNNPTWNSNKSNRTTSLTLSGGLYDSASANYYATNSTTQYTAIQNRKSEQAQAKYDTTMDNVKTGIKMAADLASSAANLAGLDTVANPGKAVSGVINAVANAAIGGIQIAQNIKDNTMSQVRANASLASSIANINTSPASTVSSPYIGICMPNFIHTEGQHLFNTYALEISEFDKKRVFINLANSGYPSGEVAPIQTFNNRQFVNVLNISTSVCSSELWNLLVNQPASIWNNEIFNTEFIAWLNSPKMIFTQNRLRNYFDPDAPNYIPNLELVMPPFPDQDSDIGQLITEPYLGVLQAIKTNYTDAQIWQIITQYNAKFLSTSLTINDLVVSDEPHTSGSSFLTITAKEGTGYSGKYTFNYLRPTYQTTDGKNWIPAVLDGGVNYWTNQLLTFNNITFEKLTSASVQIVVESQPLNFTITSITPVASDRYGNGLTLSTTDTLPDDRRPKVGIVSPYGFVFNDEIGLSKNVELGTGVPRAKTIFYNSTTDHLLKIGGYDKTWTPTNHYLYRMMPVLDRIESSYSTCRYNAGGYCNMNGTFFHIPTPMVSSTEFGIEVNQIGDPAAVELDNALTPFQPCLNAIKLDTCMYLYVVCRNTWDSKNRDYVVIGWNGSVKW